MKFSFSPRPGVTFPNFWFFLNECSDNNHYFWTKVTCHHICVLLQLNFLLFLRKILEMMALQNPILEAGKTSSCTNDWLSRNDMVLLYLPLPLRLSMTSCWVLEAQTSWSFIWKKHIYYYLLQDTYSGNFPVKKEKLGSGEVKTSSFLIWLRVDLFASKAPILVKLSWLSRILQVFQNVTSLTTESGIWDTNPLVITKAPPADQTWQVPYT